MKVAIVGGGIGGLALALALEQNGVECKVFEAAKQIQIYPDNGVLLGINGMQVLQSLRVADEVLVKGKSLNGEIKATQDFSVLAQNSFLPYEQKYGLPGVALMRSQLYDILLAKLKPGTLELGRKFSRFEDSSRVVKVYFTSGERYQADFLVGADGAQSEVRGQLFPKQLLHYTGSTSWRGISSFRLPEHLNHQSVDTFSRNSRFQFTPVGDDLVYWSAVNKEPPHGRDASKSSLLRTFKEFDPLVGSLIEATLGQTLMRTDLCELKNLHHWDRGRVALMGDAAHLFTHDLSQGISQTLEDALVLGIMMGLSDEPQTIFRGYRRRRYGKVQRSIKGSHRQAVLASMGSPVGASLRKIAFKYFPKSLSEKHLDQLFSLDSE